MPLGWVDLDLEAADGPPVKSMLCLLMARLTRVLMFTKLRGGEGVGDPEKMVQVGMSHACNTEY